MMALAMADKTLRALARAEVADVQAWRWGIVLGGFAAAVVLGFVAAKLVDLVMQRIVKRRQLPEDLPRRFVRPLRSLFIVLFARLAIEIAGMPKSFQPAVATTTTVLCIVISAWIFERALHSMTVIALHGGARVTADPERLAQRRTLRTKVVVAERIASVLIVAIAFALVALQFDVVRSVGVSLLASAGLAGVVLGFAAQRSIEALLAGLQLTFSQPIRIGDSVVIEGQFGVVEDIRLTHVAVMLWDRRRLVVPTPKFLDASFENWSRSANGMLGTIFLRVHHLTPIDAIRQELDRILESEKKWDEQTKNVQVTDAREDSLEVRVMVSAADADALWDLRVAVRERLVTWLGKEADGAYLPRARWSPAFLKAEEDDDEAPRTGEASVVARLPAR